MGVTTEGRSFLLLCYDSRRSCNTNHSASLYCTLIILGICFRLPVSSRSINYLIIFCSLLGNAVNCTFPTSHPSSEMLLNSIEFQHKSLPLQCNRNVVLRENFLVQPNIVRPTFIASYYLIALPYLITLPRLSLFQLLVNLYSKLGK